MLRDKEHLVRIAGLFAAGILGFLLLRALLVPEGFGEFGHFRSGALADNRAVPLRYAGHELCGECHDDVVQDRGGSKHETLACEACHGALADHAEAPDEVPPVLPDGGSVCLVCHTVNVSKPRSFPQVDAGDHADGEACTECHQSHHPEVQP